VEGDGAAGHQAQVEGGAVGGAMTKPLASAVSSALAVARRSTLAARTMPRWSSDSGLCWFSMRMTAAPVSMASPLTVMVPAALDEMAPLTASAAGAAGVPAGEAEPPQPASSAAVSSATIGVSSFMDEPSWCRPGEGPARRCGDWLPILPEQPRRPHGR
jgi:hypothetical protein